MVLNPLLLLNYLNILTLATNTPVDDNGNLILPPTYNKEEYIPPISTNTRVDNESNLILPPVVDVPEHKDSLVNAQKKDEIKEKSQPTTTNKQIDNVTSDNVIQKQALPKTNALYNIHYVLGLLLSLVGLKQNKKD